MKKYLAFLLAVFMLLGMMSVASAADGTYSATVSGMHGPLTVEVTLAGDRIEKVELVDNVETPGLIDWPASIVTADIVENQSLDVDVVSGVTISSRAIIRATEEALKTAGVDVEPLKAKRERVPNQDAEYEADVVIVGEPGHPEVVATLGHAPGAHIISAPEDVAYASLGDRVGIVVQTTLTESTLNAVVDAIDDETREVKLVNTICEATALRQAAASDLARTSDAMVVIGGRNSANTTHLAEICAAICPRTFHIENAEELDPDWFSGASAIGVTAGASTPSSQIDSVVKALEQLP